MPSLARDGRRTLFHDDGHYERFTRGLAEEVDRIGWIVIAYCWMPNRIHALLKTPQPNLCRGTQHWLSGYANWHAKRNRRTGHLFQGRYQAFPVEGEGYYWNLSRYIHLNPCNGSKRLAERTRERTGVADGEWFRLRSMRSWTPPRSSTEHRQTRIVATAVVRAVEMWRHCCAVAGRWRRFASCRVDSD